MKKLVASLLALLMVLGVASLAPAEEVVHFTFTPYSASTNWADNSWTERFIEENVPGIDIEVKILPHTDKEAYALALTTGDFADFIWAETWSPQMMKDNETIRSIPVEMFREYAPDYAALYDEYPEMWAKSLDPEDNTQMLCLGDFMTPYVSTYLWCWYVRYDYLMASGVDVSSLEIEDLGNNFYAAKRGMTIEQLDAFMDYCVNQDPDGNGIADTFGLVKYQYDLRKAYGLVNGVNQNVDGRPCLWYTHESVREMLTVLQDWYARGLIHPEIFTMGWGDDWELVTTGKTGIMPSGSSNWTAEWADMRPPRTLLNQGIPMVMIPGPADANGNSTELRDLAGSSQNILFVNARVTDEQLIAFLRFCEFVGFGNGDNSKRVPVQFGEEGVDFEWDENGYPVDLTGGIYNSNDVVNDRGFGYAWIQIQRGITWDYANLVPGSWYASSAPYCIDGYWDSMRAYEYKVDLLNETDATSIYNEYSSDWDEIRGAYFMKVIMGEKNVDSDWDAFLAELDEAHYNDYLDELDKVAPLVEMIGADK